MRINRAPGISFFGFLALPIHMSRLQKKYKASLKTPVEYSINPKQFDSGVGYAAFFD